MNFTHPQHRATTRPTRRIAAAVAPLVVGLGLAACGPSEEEVAANRTAAVDVVEEFGTRLVYVQKLAPPEELLDQIRDHYTPYVTTLLLGGWLADPASAPGRETSSPWPARIEVTDATPLGGTAFDMAADVVYVTSVDGEPVIRTPVALRVVQGDDGVWRISEWAPRR